MGMSTHVVGFREADENWNRMKAVWDACETAKATIPTEVLDFFGYENPNDKAGMEIDLKAALKQWNGQSSSGFEVDVTKLPPGLKIIRFYNSF